MSGGVTIPSESALPETTLTIAAFLKAAKAGPEENGLTCGFELHRVTPGLH